MKRLALVSLFGLAAVSAQAETFFDNARVRSVEPQYESVSVPREECGTHWVNDVRRTGNDINYGGVAIGGVAGGILGNQVGKGHGREAATAIGAVVGALAGNSIANNNARADQYHEVPRQVTTCRTVNEVQTRIAGYRVAYDYRGQTYTTMTRENPGQHMQVRVTMSVDPVIR